MATPAHIAGFQGQGTDMAAPSDYEMTQDQIKQEPEGSSYRPYYIEDDGEDDNDLLAGMRRRAASRAANTEAPDFLEDFTPEEIAEMGRPKTKGSTLVTYDLPGLTTRSTPRSKAVAGALDHHTNGQQSSTFELPSDFRTGPKPPNPNLRVHEADGEQAPTRCFAELPNAPFNHVLACGHEHRTNTPQACRANCEKDAMYDRKADDTSEFYCTHKICKAKKRRKQQPLRLFDNAGVRKKQRLERDTGPAALAYKMARELGIDGTAALAYGRASQKRRDAARALGPIVQPMQVANGEELANADRFNSKNRYPNSFGNGGHRDREFYTHPEFAHAEMTIEENGVAIESEANSRYRRDGVLVESEDNRVYLQQDENVDDELAPVDGEVPDTHCICEASADGYMVACEHCNRYFHPKCVGQGAYSSEEYAGEQAHTFLQDDKDRFDQGDEHLTCGQCDASRLAEEARQNRTQNMSGPKIVRMTRKQAIAAKHADAAERDEYHTDEIAEYRKTLRLVKDAGGDAMAEQEALNRLQAEMKKKDTTKFELYGEDPWHGPVKPKPKKGKSARAPAALTKVQGSTSRISKKRAHAPAKSLAPAVARALGTAAGPALETTIIEQCVTDTAIIDAIRQVPEKGPNVECDICSKDIKGLHFRCLTCEDWDCCDKCAHQSAPHVTTEGVRHDFVALHASVDNCGNRRIPPKLKGVAVEDPNKKFKPAPRGKNTKKAPSQKPAQPAITTYQTILQAVTKRSGADGEMGGIGGPKVAPIAPKRAGPVPNVRTRRAVKDADGDVDME